MARAPKDARPVIEQVEWVEHLPNSGADWGRGITQTVLSASAELEALNKRLAEMQKKHQDEEDSLKVTIRLREKLLNDTARRAGEEVTLLYANTQIDKAKAAAENAQRRREAEKPKPAGEPQQAASAGE